MTINANSPLATAFLRALISGLILGAGVAFGVYATVDTGGPDGWKPVIVAFGVTLLGTGGLRGFAEGLMDNSRNNKGEVRGGDVTPGVVAKA